MGELNGRRGMFPSNFCQPYSGGGGGGHTSAPQGGQVGHYEGGDGAAAYEETPSPRVVGVPLFGGAGQSNELMEKLKRRTQAIPKEATPGRTAGSPPPVAARNYPTSPAVGASGPAALSSAPVGFGGLRASAPSASQSVRITPAERRTAAGPAGVLSPPVAARGAPAPAPAVAEPPANARASVRTTTNLRDRLRESASPPTIPAAAVAEPIGPGKLRRTKEASAEAPQPARPESPSVVSRANTTALASRASRENSPTAEARAAASPPAVAVAVESGHRWPSSLPPFSAFCQELVGLFEAARQSTAGAGTVSAQPAWLAKSDPSSFGFAVCTVDGAQFAHGDAGLPFTLQQCSYPINFALCADEIGLAKGADEGVRMGRHDTQVGKVVGNEGVGGGDAFTLNADKKPHNPITLAGALAVCGALTSASPASDPSTRLARCLEGYAALSSPPKLAFGGGSGGGLSVSMPSYLTLSQDHDNKVRGLAHWLRANEVVDAKANLGELVDLFYQLCSVETTCQGLAAIAATLANAGSSPLTARSAVSKAVATQTVQILNVTDKWAQSIHLAAKSSLSGAILVVVPGVLGLAVYSPRLSPQMKSVAGTKFCEAIATTFPSLAQPAA